MCCFKQILEATPHKTATIKPLPSQKTIHVRETASKTRMNLLVTFFYEPLHIDVSVLANKLELSA